MNMFMLVVTSVLAVLYGLAWHDEPAPTRRPERRPTKNAPRES